MKRLGFILFSSVLFVSCKTTQTVSNLDRNGFEVVYIGYNPEDTLVDVETYHVSDTDSLEFHYNMETKQTLIYLVEETRYAVLNENFKLLWFESK
jgi:hypothetical protein